MWLITLEVTATQECEIDPHPEWGPVLGAYVNALISFPEPHGAKHLAKMYTTEGDHQWHFKDFLSCQKVSISNFKGDNEFIDCFKEAERDGYSLVFHIYGSGNEHGAKSDASTFTENT